jgi:hypothetical protein
MRSVLRRYKLTFYATDGTAKAEMFCFDTIAKQIVGKPCQVLLRTLDASQSTPADLRAVVGHKFTFAVNININSYYLKQRILNVNSVIQAYGRQELETASDRTNNDANSLRTSAFSLRLPTEESPATAMRRLTTSPTTSSVSILSYLHNYSVQPSHTSQ